MALLDDIRLDIGDDGATPRYTDTQLANFVAKAARRVNRTLSLLNTDAISVDSSGNITQPESPTDEITDILLLQTECLIYSREVSSATTQNGAGALVRDGEQLVDTRGQANLITSLKDADSNPCEQLQRAITQYLLEESDVRDIW